MRVLLKAQMDVEKGNQAIKDGTLPQALQSVMGDLKPEAAYFAPLDGKRTALIFFDLEDPSDLPRVSEPFFSLANASVEVMPCMDVDDLQAGLQKIS
jgi:hypothetical protein